MRDTIKLQIMTQETEARCQKAVNSKCLKFFKGNFTIGITKHYFCFSWKKNKGIIGFCFVLFYYSCDKYSTIYLNKPSFLEMFFWSLIFSFLSWIVLEKEFSRKCPETKHNSVFLWTPFNLAHFLPSYSLLIDVDFSVAY